MYEFCFLLFCCQLRNLNKFSCVMVQTEPIKVVLTKPEAEKLPPPLVCTKTEDDDDNQQNESDKKKKETEVRHIKLCSSSEFHELSCC